MNNENSLKVDALTKKKVEKSLLCRRRRGAPTIFVFNHRKKETERKHKSRTQPHILQQHRNKETIALSETGPDTFFFLLTFNYNLIFIWTNFTLEFRFSNYCYRCVCMRSPIAVGYSIRARQDCIMCMDVRVFADQI